MEYVDLYLIHASRLAVTGIPEMEKMKEVGLLR